MKLNYNKGAIPLYLQIKEEIKKQIEDKTYTYGQLIPSELEYEKFYKVSRITVRQAILDLEKDGYVKRTRGKGTSVTFSDKIDENLSAIRSFSKEMEDRGKVAVTLYTEIDKVKADDAVAKQLQLEVGDDVFRLYRVRGADNEAIVVFETYLLGKYDFPLEKQPYEFSMYRVFESLGIYMPVKVQEKLEATLADTKLSKALDVPLGSAIFKRTRTAYNELNEPIEFTYSYYRADRYAYSIQLQSK